MLTVEETEGMIQDLGGVLVQYDRLSPNSAGQRQTWGLKKAGQEVFGPAGAEVYAPAEIVVIAAGRLEAEPVNMDSIIVAGVARVVTDHRLTEGAIRVLLQIGDA